MKGASMALLHDIQAALLDDAVGVGSILLKLRFLAAKLDADILEEWVQHEVEGYPDDVPVPEYRIAHVTYKGTFVGLGQQLNNTSISGQVVEQYAGKGWVNFEIRTGLPVIDQTLNNRSERGQFGIDASDLKVRLQGKIYEGMAIVEITGRIDDGEILRVQQTVRSKTLDFVLKLEKSVPATAEITVGQPSASITPAAQRDVKSLTQQIFIGEVTNIQTGSGSSVALNVAKGDTADLLKALTTGGIPAREAEELVEIASREPPEEEEANAWLTKKLRSGAAEAWGIGKKVALEVGTEALKQYYGLK